MAEQDFSEYRGKKVIVTQNKGDGAVEVEGLVETTNTLGILIKPKGKTNLVLIEASEVESVRYAPEKIKQLKPKSLAPVQYGQARQHLADRHGYALKDLAEYPEADAFDFHKTIDHSDLGHNHDPKPEPEAEAEVAGESDEA